MDICGASWQYGELKCQCRQILRKTVTAPTTAVLTPFPHELLFYHNPGKIYPGWKMARWDCSTLTTQNATICNQRCGKNFWPSKRADGTPRAPFIVAMRRPAGDEGRIAVLISLNASRIKLMVDQVSVDAKTLDDICCLSTVTVYDIIDAIKEQRSNHEKRNGGGWLRLFSYTPSMIRFHRALQPVLTTPSRTIVSQRWRSTRSSCTIPVSK